MREPQVFERTAGRAWVLEYSYEFSTTRRDCMGLNPHLKVE